MGWFSKSTDNFLLSTTTPANIGVHIFRDMFSSVRDVAGDRAGGY